MSTRGILASLVVAFLLVLPAKAEYTSIQANMLDGLPDTNYTNGVMTISSNTATSQLTLNDPSALGGTVTNFDLDLVTTFHHVYWDGPDLKAVFSGGDFSLSFDHESTPYYIQGPISNLVFWVSGVGETSYIDGQGLFDAVFDLPGSGDWPAPAQSSIKSLTMAFHTDLSEFDWESNLTGPMETVVTLYPDDSAIPGPATLLLLVPGVALLRRR
ncbi:MAG: hypothetical protein JSU68_00900 [Phycisphaerales bacterium]|nr:MAG: hypothetical protein JSU68_00900 [Phycisphaerales bacterium]